MISTYDRQNTAADAACYLPAIVKFMTRAYRNECFSSWLENAHIRITAPVATAESELHTRVGTAIQGS